MCDTTEMLERRKKKRERGNGKKCDEIARVKKNCR